MIKTIIASLFSKKDRKSQEELEQEQHLKDQEELDNLSLEQKQERIEEIFLKLSLTHSEVMERYALVGKIISAKPNDSKAFLSFNSICDNEFMDFGKKLSASCLADIKLKLNSVKQELQEIYHFRAIFHKNILAIGGGFSSGKSAFINSLIQDKTIHLAENTNPTTALPTYVANGSNNKIRIYSRNGGRTNIESSVYNKISHDYIKTFNFDLKDIIPFMAIETALAIANKSFNNICFIDTPGYNPAQDANTSNDALISKEYLKKANALIWAIELDTNGTIPKSDIEFLESLELNNKPLYY